MDAALVRAATVTPDELTLPRAWPDLSHVTRLPQWCDWLVEAWSAPHVAAAVSIASPSLAARVEQVCQGRRSRPAELKRMILSLSRYLVRMRGRPTPFGVFAGVAPLRFGAEASVSWLPELQCVRTRSAAVWVSQVIGRLEACPGLLRRLPVVLNDLTVVRGDRLVVTWQPHATAPARAAASEVSVRLTPQVQALMDHARTPIVVGDLVDKLVAESPQVPAPLIEAMLVRLVAGGVLITCLRPPSTSADGLGHLLAQLEAVNAGSVEELAPLLDELLHIQASLGLDGAMPSARMKAITAAEYPVVVDLRAGCDLTLPEQVAREAAAATDALIRLSPYPRGHVGWQAYHSAFLSRFGANAVVPIGLLVDPVHGLGFPDHFTDDSRDLPSALTPRDTRLLAVAQQAALDGAREIVLDNAFIDGLHLEGTDEMLAPAHLEICAEVRAKSIAELAAGHFWLVVSGISRTGAALSGRFIDLLPDDDTRRMKEAYDGLPTSVQGAIPVQLSFPPSHPHLENVARAPRLLPELLTVGEHRTGDERSLSLSDLAVTADNNGMYLVSLSRRRVVEPMLTNAAARRTMPPIVRLLFELPRALVAASSPFTWGAARCLPFLPRVVHGRTVLALARWSIPAAELPSPGLPQDQWRTEFEVLRKRHGLPDVVSVGDSDLRLRLHLDESRDSAVLRDHLDGVRATGKPALIFETSTPGDWGWFGGRAHEIIVPLATTDPPSAAPVAAATDRPWRISGRDEGVLPGGRLAFAKLYADARVFDTILVDHLPRLLSEWEEQPRWWFVRYRDPAPHLRLRVHLDGTGHAEAILRIGQWADDLRRLGLSGDLTFATYRPETARYGGGEALAAAEALFAADSAVVLAQLTALRSAPGLDPLAVTAAGLVDLVIGLIGGRREAMRWLVQHGDIGAAPPAGRDTVRRAVELACEQAELATSPWGERIAAAWAARRNAAAVYRPYLDESVSGPLTVIHSLLHMNHIRARGIDPEDERTVHRLARAVALSWTSRNSLEQGRRA